MFASLESVLEGVAPLPHLGVLHASGEDARKFLHSQLTHDLALMRPDQARLAAFLSAKGRMQASFVVLPWREHDVLLICSRDLMAATAKRLSMFVLRAKVKIADASAQFDLRGLAGSAATGYGGGDLAPWALSTAGAARVVGLYPADGVARALWVAPLGEPEPRGVTLDSAWWALGEVRSGVATLSAPLVDAFVPQMLNYESVDGVHFKKGCYPGQEIVARSQFRGTLKRRAYLAESTTPLPLGAELFVPGVGTEPVAIVAQSASAPQAALPSEAPRHEAIICLQLSAAQNPLLALGAADGPAVRIRPAPYPLLADI